MLTLRSVNVVVLEALPHLLPLHRPDPLHCYCSILFHAAEAQEGKCTIFQFLCLVAMYGYGEKTNPRLLEVGP